MSPRVLWGAPALVRAGWAAGSVGPCATWPTSDVVLLVGCTILSTRCRSTGDKRHRGQVPPSPSAYR